MSEININIDSILFSINIFIQFYNYRLNNNVQFSCAPLPDIDDVGEPHQDDIQCLTIDLSAQISSIDNCSNNG